MSVTEMGTVIKSFIPSECAKERKNDSLSEILLFTVKKENEYFKAIFSKFIDKTKKLMCITRQIKFFCSENLKNSILFVVCYK